MTPDQLAEGRRLLAACPNQPSGRFVTVELARWLNTHAEALIAADHSGDANKMVLHDAIMNIPPREPDIGQAYMLGHRDARLAAAKLAAKYCADHSGDANKMVVNAERRKEIEADSAELAIAWDLREAGSATVADCDRERMRRTVEDLLADHATLSARNACLTIQLRQAKAKLSAEAQAADEARAELARLRESSYIKCDSCGCGILACNTKRGTTGRLCIDPTVCVSQSREVDVLQEQLAEARAELAEANRETEQLRNCADISYRAVELPDAGQIQVRFFPAEPMPVRRVDLEE